MELCIIFKFFFIIQPKNFLCSHAFCGYCIDKWLLKKKECPVCRSKVTTAVPNHLLANLIEKAVEALSEENKQNRISVIKEREGKAFSSVGNFLKHGKQCKQLSI